MVLTELAPYLGTTLSEWEVYGLFFLLGSFTVASLSDVRHMSAQREFLEVWAIFAVAIFAIELYTDRLAFAAPLVVKWILIVVLSLLSWDRVGVLFQLARADVAALAAAASLLSPLLVLVLFALAKLLSVPLGALLRKGSVYPFLPIVTVATLALMAISVYVVPILLPAA